MVVDSNSFGATIMKTICLLILAGVMLCPSVSFGQAVVEPASPPVGPAKVATEKKLQSVIDEVFRQHPDSVGLMVHVEAPDQGISWSGAVGVADLEKKTPVNPKQPALIASNVKTYMSAAVLRLVEDGALKTDQPIAELISEKSAGLLRADGYDLKAIKVSHLLSHTSGLHDYIDENYLVFTQKNPRHRWTRDEQIALSVKIGEPLGDPGEVFRYADVNFLLLGEILERLTAKPFFTAIRDLIGYKKNDLDETWFFTLEEKPANALPLVHQYYTSMGFDSYEIDTSFDLYGAGGIAATTEDLALFSQSLFNGEIVENHEVLKQIFTSAETTDGTDHHYHFGLSSSEIEGFQAYGHGGFWGTVVQHIPKLNASIAVFVLERDKRILRKDILESTVRILAEGSETK